MANVLDYLASQQADLPLGWSAASGPDGARESGDGGDAGTGGAGSAKTWRLIGRCLSLLAKNVGRSLVRLGERGLARERARAGAASVRTGR